MKASEIIKILATEIVTRGDLEVQFWGLYGATSEQFQTLKDKDVNTSDRDKINIWTGMNTG